MKVCIEDSDYILVNFYCPNNDSPAVYKELKEQLHNRQKAYIIMTVDWNLLLRPSLDYCNYKRIYNPYSRKLEKNLMQFICGERCSQGLKAYLAEKTSTPTQGLFLISETLAGESNFIKDRTISLD